MAWKRRLNCLTYWCAAVILYLRAMACLAVASVTGSLDPVSQILTWFSFESCGADPWLNLLQVGGHWCPSLSANTAQRLLETWHGHPGLECEMSHPWHQQKVATKSVCVQEAVGEWEWIWLRTSRPFKLKLHVFTPSDCINKACIHWKLRFAFIERYPFWIQQPSPVKRARTANL